MQAKFWPGGGPEPHFFLAFEKKRPYSEKNSTRKRFFGGRRERRLIGLQALGRHMLLELVDLFSGGAALKPDVAADYLVEQFGAERASIVELQRGVFVQSAFPMPHK